MLSTFPPIPPNSGSWHENELRRFGEPNQQYWFSDLKKVMIHLMLVLFTKDVISLCIPICTAGIPQFIQEAVNYLGAK